MYLVHVDGEEELVQVEQIDLVVHADASTRHTAVPISSQDRNEARA